jgi:hypothetical protein
MTDQDTGTSARTRLRRLLRHRTARAVTAAAVVGALLGAGTVGWRTGTLPFAQESRPCWDSLSDETLDILFDPRSRKEAEEEKPLEPGWSARCRVLGHALEENRKDKVEGRLDIGVRTLDGRTGYDAHSWPAEFLSTAMTPIGGGLPGMASDSRAWISLPRSCVDGGETVVGGQPVVVEARMGRPGSDLFPERRNGLARAVVESANGLLGAYGCLGRYRLPEPTPDLAERRATAELCGLADAPVPAKHRERLEDVAQNWVDGGPARICGVDHPDADFRVRLTTVTDPVLARIFAGEAWRGGPPVRGGEGSGTITPTRAVFVAWCQTGDVAFVMEEARQEDSDWTFVRDLFPLYVAAEAERLGCGTRKVTLPRT